MLTESNARMAKITKGGYDRDQSEDAQRELKLQLSLLNVILRGLEITTGQRSLKNQLKAMNIMDSSVAVDLGIGDPELDKIKCPAKDDLILRADCLDYSGSHSEECNGCENRKETQDLLLGTQV